MGDVTLSAGGYEPETRRVHRLRVIYSCDGAAPRAVPLDRSEVVLGRSPPAGIAVSDPRMSREHAAFRRSPNGLAWLVEDLGSKNGVAVNGVATPLRVLENSDAIRLGDTLVVYEVGEELGDDATPESEYVGESLTARRLRCELVRASTSRVSIVLHGESGSGKEVAAHAIHRLSGRTGRFQPVNCGAIPEQLVESTLFGHRRGAFTGAVEHSEGQFMAADRGTLFLDEVADLPLPAQATLLRVLEDGLVTPVGATKAARVDVRVIAASHVDLPSAVRAGRFRADLHARLAGWTIQIPALRERRGDILQLAEHVAGFLGPSRLDPDAAEALVVALWTANVRELRSVVERALLLAGGSAVRLRHLPEEVAEPIRARTTLPSPDAAQRPTADELLQVLKWARGNIAKVADRYGRTRKQIYRWLEHYEISLDSFREPAPRAGREDP